MSTTSILAHLIGEPKETDRHPRETRTAVPVVNDRASAIVFGDPSTVDPALVDLLAGPEAVCLRCFRDQVTVDEGGARSDKADALLALFNARDVTEGMNAARSFFTATKQTVVLRNFGVFRSPVLDALFQQLAVLVMEGRVRLVILTHSYASVQGGDERPSLAEMSRRYRQRVWTADDVSQRYFGGRIDAPSLTAILKFAGGHPRFTPSVIRSCCKVVDETSEGFTVEGPFPVPDEVHRSSSAFFRGLAAGELAWMSQLRDLVVCDAEVTECLRSYVMGFGGDGSRGLDAAERALFFAGWIGYRADDGRWGIASELHRRVAREFLVRGDGEPWSREALDR